MRSLLLACSLFAATDALADDTLAGSWSVTVTETGIGTCQMSPGKVTAYVWIISTQPDGAVTVSVQGQTPFPVLGGQVVGDTLVLRAFAQMKGRTDATWINLKLKGSTMTGLRRHLSVQPQQFATRKVNAPCFLDLDVQASKTG